MNQTAIGASRLFSALAWCLLILMVVTGWGCRKEPPPTEDVNESRPGTAAEVSTPSAPEVPTGTSSEPDADTVVVTVNGHEIGEREVARRIGLRMRQFGSRLASLPPEFAGQVKKQIRQQVVDNLIAEQLLNEQVKAANIQITEADVVAEMERTAAAQQPPISLDELRRRVEAQGGRFDDVKDEFRRGMGYRKVMESQWADKLNVTEADARTYYDEHPKEFETPEQVRASHILISTETTDPNTDPNEAKIVARTKAEELLKEIKGGADFAELAKAHSSCSSSARGGDLDFFARDSMVKPFEDAAFSMEPGQVSDVVETKFGYHIIKVTDHRDAADVPFEQAREDITAKLTKEKKAAISKQYIQSLRENATIIYASPSEPQAAPSAPPASTGSAEG